MCYLIIYFYISSQYILICWEINCMFRIFYHINRHKISKIVIKNIKIDDVFYILFCLKPNRR